MGTPTRLVILVALCALALGLPTGARAARDLDVTRLRPSPHAGDVLAVKGARIPVRNGLGAGLLSHYSRDALVFREQATAGTKRIAAVRHRLTVVATAALALGRRTSVGLQMPAVLTNAGEDGAADLAPGSASGIGDLGLSVKSVLLAPDARWWGLAVALDARAPTGTKGAWMRDPGVGLFPHVVVDMAFGASRLSLNLGYRFRDRFEVRDLVVDDEIDARIGALVPLSGSKLSFFGQILGSSVASGDFGKSASTWLEIDAGVTVRLNERLSLLAGAGFGPSAGVGSTAFRALVGFGYGPAPLW